MGERRTETIGWVSVLPGFSPEGAIISVGSSTTEDWILDCTMRPAFCV
jgi:hypothetical protein